MAINKIAPDYISNLICLKESRGYSIRSSNTILLKVPSEKSIKILGDRAFCIAFCHISYQKLLIIKYF